MFFSLAIPSTVSAQFTLNVKAGDEFTWRVTELNESVAYDLGIESTREVGMQKRFQLTSIKSSGNKWIINATFWNYLTPLSEPGNATQLFVQKTPSASEITSLFLPTPLSAYLTSLNTSLSSEQAAIISFEKLNSENLNAIKYKIQGDTVYSLREYDQQTGVLFSHTYYKSGKIVYRSELERLISSYDFYTLTFIVLGTISLFSFIYRRKLFR